MANQYKVKKIRGITFFFKYEPSQPELLHIYVRHLTTIEEAITVFFESEPTFNKQYDRYENSNETHTIYWNWINESEKKIIIITCFKK